MCKPSYSKEVEAIHAKLKKCEPDIRLYLRALEKENAKLQAENVSAQHLIIALKRQLDKHLRHIDQDL